MLNLIRFYVSQYLDVISRKPDMNDGDGYLSECMDDWQDIQFCIDVWSIASCL